MPDLAPVRPDPLALARTFDGQLRASPAETALLARYMVAADRYLEYGAGGSTRMALAAGIGRITTIETDRAFRDALAAEAAVAPHIASGRLSLIHADIGPTENWGYPLEPPSDAQLARLLDWPGRSSPIDLVLIDGRYRVAATAAACLASPGAAVLIHDYAPRPWYHAVERILQPIEAAEEMAAFRFSGNAEAAYALLAEYRTDMR